MRHLADPASLTPSLLSWLFVVALLALLPVAVLLQERHVSAREHAGDPITRRDIYIGAVVTHAVLLAAAVLTARDAGVQLFAARAPSPRDLLVGAAAVAIGALTLAERLTPVDARARTELMAPRTRGEYAAFAVVAVSAGVAEEIAYRGVLFALLAQLLGGWWLPAAVGAVAFGVVHLFQGRRAAVAATGAGLVAQLVVGLTGTLLVAIAVHILHDLIAGAVIGRRARRRSSGGEPVAV